MQTPWKSKHPRAARISGRWWTVTPSWARRTRTLSLPARWPAPTAMNTTPGCLHACSDPVGPAAVPLGEHQAGRCPARSSVELLEHADEHGLIAAFPRRLHLGHGRDRLPSPRHHRPAFRARADGAAAPAACGEHGKLGIRASRALRAACPRAPAARRRTMSAPLPTCMPCERPASIARRVVARNEADGAIERVPTGVRRHRECRRGAAGPGPRGSEFRAPARRMN